MIKTKDGSDLVMKSPKKMQWNHETFPGGILRRSSFFGRSFATKEMKVGVS